MAEEKKTVAAEETAAAFALASEADGLTDQVSSFAIDHTARGPARRAA